MKVAISAVRTQNTKLNRHELITAIQDLGHEVIYIGQESSGEIHSDYEKYNVSFLSIPLGRNNTNPFKELGSIFKTYKVLRKNNIKAIIIYGIRTFPTMVLAAKLAGIKNILCVVNGSGRLFQLNGLRGLLVKTISYPMLGLAFMKARHVLFQNSDDLLMLRKKKLIIKKNYSTVNGSGVNLDEFPYCELEKKPVFTMISRITGSKGVNEYLKAAKTVKVKFPGTTFNLIGPMDDNDASIDQELLHEYVDNNIIILKGKVEDVRPYIKQTRFFVLPSYYPEGVPRSVLEAMSMGRPIITTDLPGCKETVTDGVNGFLIPPRNENNLAEKMIWMIENDRRTLEMGYNSRKIAVEKFDVNKVNKIMLSKINLLEEVSLTP